MSFSRDSGLLEQWHERGVADGEFSNGASTAIAQLFQTFVAVTRMNTFDDLRHPFDLFKAPLAHAVFDAAGDCVHCHSAADVRFHELCYSCFRNGFSDSAIDTELGMVTRELAELGMTHGLPLNDPSEFANYGTTAHPIDPLFPNETWFHIHISAK